VAEYEKKPIRILRTDRRWENLRRRKHPEERRVRSIITNSQDLGYTFTQIVDRLNRAGISTVSGRVWNASILRTFMYHWGHLDYPEQVKYRKRVLREKAVSAVMRRLRFGPDVLFTAASLLTHLREEEWHRYVFGIHAEIGQVAAARVEETLQGFVGQGRLEEVRHGVYRVVWKMKL